MLLLLHCRCLRQQVGRGMLTLGECVKYGLLAAAMVAAAAATSALPHQLLAGCALLAAVAIATWLCCPAALTQAYQHMNLNYRRQWLLLKHLRSAAIPDEFVTVITTVLSETVCAPVCQYNNKLYSFQLELLDSTATVACQCSPHACQCCRLQ